MKRLRVQGGDGRVESVKTAEVLMLLSRGNGAVEEKLGRAAGARPTSRLFECKRCHRKFSTFQALGGHHTSHRKPKPLALGDRLDQTTSSHVAKKQQQQPPKGVHECSICGLEFGIGQALGGHMKRHRRGGPAETSEALHFSLGRHSKKRSRCASGRHLSLDLDLNLPPMEDSMDEFLTLGLGM